MRLLAELRAALASEVPVEEVQVLLAELYHAIAEMVAAAEAHERARGVSAIEEMLDIDFEEAEESGAKLGRCATYLRTALQHPANNEEASLRATSAALGHLARVGGELAAEAVDAEARRALEMLKPDSTPRERTELRLIGFEPRRADAGEMRNELRLLSAACVLGELADSAPTLLYAHLSTGFERIWCHPSP